MQRPTAQAVYNLLKSSTLVDLEGTAPSSDQLSLYTLILFVSHMVDQTHKGRSLALYSLSKRI